MRRTALALIALAASPAASFAQAVGLSPTQIGEIFCMSALSGDEAPIRALLSPVLAADIAYSEARNDAIARAAPGDKPPLGDGIPWASFPDYAPKCSVGPITFSATQTNVAIAYSIPDAPDADWQDQLVLVDIPAPSGAGPYKRIDDIVYGTGGSLQSALVTLFEP